MLFRKFLERKSIDSTALYLLGENPHISGPPQFKPMLSGSRANCAFQSPQGLTMGFLVHLEGRPVPSHFPWKAYQAFFLCPPRESTSISHLVLHLEPSFPYLTSHCGLTHTLPGFFWSWGKPGHRRPRTFKFAQHVTTVRSTYDLKPFLE